MKRKKRPKPKQKTIKMERILPLIPLVDQVIKNHFHWAIPRLQSHLFTLDDLRQEGLLGIIRALQLFNPKKGQLTVYGKWHIRGAIGRFIWHNYFPNITLPPNRNKRTVFLPINEPLNEDSPNPLESIIAFQNYAIQAPYNERQKSITELALIILRQIQSGEDRQIVQKYFGICACNRKTKPHYHIPMTTKEIADNKDLTQQRISQILQQTLASLTKNKTIRKLQPEWKSL